MLADRRVRLQGLGKAAEIQVIFPKSARRYQARVRLLGEGPEGAKVYRVGERSVTAFVLGRGPGGGWLGLRTKAVET